MIVYFQSTDESCLYRHKTLSHELTCITIDPNSLSLIVTKGKDSWEIPNIQKMDAKYNSGQDFKALEAEQFETIITEIKQSV